MENTKNDVFVSLLKQHTNIDHDFINTFFNKFKIGGDFNFDIKDKTAANYLGIALITLRKRLLNRYSKTKQFIENVDYIKLKKSNKTGATYMINYQCFEKLAMGGDSPKSETIRMYFIKLRQFIVENQQLIYQAMENKKILNKYSGYESIYFFVIDEKYPNIIKIGRTIDIVQRLRNYNVGRINEIDLKYYALVKNSLLIENCLKLRLKKNQVYENKEIFKIDARILKKVIYECYCKYVSKKQNKELHEGIAELLGLYAYVKKKPTLQPYVIIGKNL